MRLKEIIRKRTYGNAWLERVWLRLAWLKTNWNMRYSDFDYAKILTKDRVKRGFDFEHPSSYNEKLWFLKLSNRDPLMTQCSDKHAVRAYVEACGLGHILKKEYATFSSAQQIDFSKLPSPGYLKCNHASGMNVVYRAEQGANEKHLRWEFDFLLTQNPYCLSREWNYKEIAPCIVCEELLSAKDPNADILEIQFFCFHGEPMFFLYNLGLADAKGNHKDATRWAFWLDGTLLDPGDDSYCKTTNGVVLPDNLDEMIAYARILSRPFVHVRVDLFNLDGKIYLSELTFYSHGGDSFRSSEELQKICGDAMDLTGFSIAPDAYERGLKRVCQWRKRRIREVRTASKNSFQGEATES